MHYQNKTNIQIQYHYIFQFKTQILGQYKYQPPSQNQYQHIQNQQINYQNQPQNQYHQKNPTQKLQDQNKYQNQTQHQKPNSNPSNDSVKDIQNTIYINKIMTTNIILTNIPTNIQTNHIAIKITTKPINSHTVNEDIQIISKLHQNTHKYNNKMSYTTQHHISEIHTNPRNFQHKIMKSTKNPNGPRPKTAQKLIF